MKHHIKSLLLANPALNWTYGYFHEKKFENDYRRRREYYESAIDSGLAYQTQAAISRAREKIAGRGYTPAVRSIGEVHTFAHIPSNWPHQNHIASALKKLGPVTRFDYLESGFRLEDFCSRNSNSPVRREAMLSLMLKRLRAAHQARPVDWFFSYALGWDMTAATIKEVQDEFGIPTVNISLDDKNWWEEVVRGDPASGLKNIAPCYDLGWTSASSVVAWYWVEGGQAIFLQEGVDSDWFRPLEIARDIQVGFVGSNFGHRPSIIAGIRKAGIPVEVCGPGWPAGELSDIEMVEFFNRCKINLGIGDMHYSRWLTNLKGRDFEIPSSGGGLYITSYNSELARSFGIAEEIVCYRGLDEAIELIRYYLRNPDEAGAIVARAREKCVRCHQWQHRFAVILRAFGIITDGNAGTFLP